jgi:hypothetical protein
MLFFWANKEAEPEKSTGQLHVGLKVTNLVLATKNVIKPTSVDPQKPFYT